MQQVESYPFTPDSAVQYECIPGNCKQLIARAEKASKGKHGVGNLSLLNINHQFFDLSQAISLRILHGAGNQCCGQIHCKNRTVSCLSGAASLILIGGIGLVSCGAAGFLRH